MDEYAFLASIVKSLAWPVTVLLLVKQLPFITKHIEKLKWGDGEVVFSKRVEKAERALRKNVPRSSSGDMKQVSMFGQKKMTAQMSQINAQVPESIPVQAVLDQITAESLERVGESLSPTFIVLSAWLPLEQKVAKLYTTKISDKIVSNFGSQLTVLMQRNIIPYNVGVALLELLAARNVAAEGRRKITDEEAFAFEQSVENVLSLLPKD